MTKAQLAKCIPLKQNKMAPDVTMNCVVEATSRNRKGFGKRRRSRGAQRCGARKRAGALVRVL